MDNTAFASQSSDTVSKRVQFLAENYPHRELFVFYQGKTRDPYTCQKLFQLAGRFANRLRHQYGFKRDDILANTLPNSPERLITDLGITLAGCTCLNGQILLADGSDFSRSARNSRCRGVIVRPEEDVAAWRLLKPFVIGDQSSGVTELSYDQAPDMTTAILVSRGTNGPTQPLLQSLRDKDQAVYVDQTIGPDNIIYIFSTSGSTGYSKLVARTHANVLKMTKYMRVAHNDDSTNLEEIVLYSDRLLGWPGGFPYHSYGHGQKRVLLDWFEIEGGKQGGCMWNAIEREQCTMGAIFPLELDSILKHVASIGGSDYKLKTLFTGAQPMKKPHLQAMLSIAEQVCVAYGSTEAAPITIGIIQNADDVEDFYCGRPPVDVQLRFIDANEDDCKPRQAGTLLVKAPCVFKGYFNRLQDPDPNTVKCFTKEGWFNTEDIGFLDEVGNVYVMGRNKDTIMYGSSVLYPGWLEAAILQHPDIQEACVLPVSDPVLFHNICACVQRTIGSDLNEEKLKTYCESIFIADLQSDLTPMPQFFMVFDTFPETPTGKPDKQTLRRMAEEKFGLVKTISV